jgi:hypothetical protein
MTEKLLRFFAVFSYHALSPAAYYELQSNRCEFGSPRLTENATRTFSVSAGWRLNKIKRLQAGEFSQSRHVTFTA